MRLALLLITAASALCGADGVVTTRYLEKDVDLTLDPKAAVWSRATPVAAERGRRGEPEKLWRTDVRTRWSDRYLYFFYTGPYQQLYLKPNPQTTADTNQLWDWDVAEAFIGTDPQNIGHYTEYEVSPQGEWVDLDIDRSKPGVPGIGWNSGFESRASIDRDRKVWYAAMKIPFEAIGVPKPAGGQTFKVNFYRIEGAPPNRTYITWQPVNSDSFHEPKAFGTMKLVK
jgi:hypothetical protein